MRAPIILVLMAATFAVASIRHVPQSYPTIQAAMDHTLPGDTVLADLGSYVETVLIPPYDVTLAGPYLFSLDSAQIDQSVLLAANGRCVIATASGKSRLLRLVGMRFFGGVSQPGTPSGGVYAHNRNLEIRACHFDSSYALEGGAFYADSCDVYMRDSRLRTVGARRDGQAFYVRSCRTLAECTEIGPSYAMLSDWQNVVSVERGYITLRDCRWHDTGWDILPGTYGIRQIDTVSSITFVSCDIVHNRIRTFLYPQNVYFPGPVMHAVFDSNYVAENEFFYYLYVDPYEGDGTSAVFRDNVFENNRPISEGNYGSNFFFALVNQFNTYVDIRRNLFLNNIGEKGFGLIYHVSPLRTHIEYNYIIGDSAIGFLWPPGGIMVAAGTPPGVIRHNIFASNHSYAVFNGAPPIAYATHNYWGDPSGPLHHVENPNGQGDSVEVNVSVTPWEGDTSFMESNYEFHLPPGPLDYLIGFAYPNPFNSSVTIEYTLTSTQDVTLEILDLLGRQVEVIEQGRKRIGVHQAVWNAGGKASGVYFARLTAEGSRQRPWVQKLLLLK